MNLKMAKKYTVHNLVDLLYRIIHSFIFRALKVPVDIVEKCKQTAAALFLSSFFEKKARENLNLSDLKKTSSSP